MMKSNIGVVLLAAGNSSRMGQGKIFLPMAHGKSFVEHSTDLFDDYGIKNIVVVTQFKYLEALEELYLNKAYKPFFVVNNNPEYERFYSLQLGIKALGEVAFSFIHNVDCPFFDGATLELLDLNKGKADYICPEFNKQGGHPILVNRATLDYLLNRPSDAVLKEELKSKTRLNIPVKNEFITVDIDTPEEYNKYLI
ncbi:MAG: NTP transferase domain-containing protein [Bacteroidetes bacterium]|nr:NTP transferase domain-containing protein [Bacteroidota bacterium]